MNRRNAIKAALAGIAAACGWKAKAAGPLRGYWLGESDPVAAINQAMKPQKYWNVTYGDAERAERSDAAFAELWAKSVKAEHEWLKQNQHLLSEGCHISWEPTDDMVRMANGDIKRRIRCNGYRHNGQLRPLPQEMMDFETAKANRRMFGLTVMVHDDAASA